LSKTGALTVLHHDSSVSSVASLIVLILAQLFTVEPRQAWKSAATYAKNNLQEFS
jgi:hypothetical protein